MWDVIATVFWIIVMLECALILAGIFKGRE